VLVGGTPPILAHAALTRNFDVQNEIEVKDNLDKKPDDEKALTNYASSFEELFVLTSDYLAKNQKQLGGRYEFDCLVNVGIYADGSGHTVRCSGGSGLFWGGFISPLVKLNQAFFHTNAKESQQVRINLVLSSEEFLLKTVLNQDLPEQAEQYRNFYNVGLSRIKIQQLDSSKTNLYENTKISSENNQVFIVTRLPRGSLEDHLKNAKAESK
jgi:hypothetical protein